MGRKLESRYDVIAIGDGIAGGVYCSPLIK